MGRLRCTRSGPAGRRGWGAGPELYNGSRWSTGCRLHILQALHDGQVEGGGARKKPVKLLKILFLKKFVSYAKARVKSKLSGGVRELIVQHYAELRQKVIAAFSSLTITCGWGKQRPGNKWLQVSFVQHGNANAVVKE